MNIQEYRKIIEKTAIYPTKVDNFGVAYLSFGLIGELEEQKTASLDLEADYSEIKLKNLKKESGDVFWYMAALAIRLNLDLPFIFSNTGITNFTDAENSTIYSFCENIKKYYRDSKPIDKEKLTLILRNIYLQISNDLNDNNVYVSDVFQMNYDKLIKRRQTGTIQGDGDNREEINNA